MSADLGTRSRPVRPSAEPGSPPTDRVVAVVELLAAEPSRTYSLTEIARTADVTPATCHAILASLTRADWVVRDPRDRSYGLGPAMLALGQAAASGYPAARAAESELAVLAAALGMPATSSVLDGDSIVVVGAAGERPGAASMVGHRIAFAPPIGMVFTAWSPEAERTEWLSRVSVAHEDELGDLLSAVEQSRRRGFVLERFTPVFLQLRRLLSEVVDDPRSDRLQDAAQSLIAHLGFAEFLPAAPQDGESLDVTIVGAPVFAPSGRVVANLSVHPGRELAAAELAEVADALVAAAARVTRSIGGKPR